MEVESPVALLRAWERWQWSHPWWQLVDREVTPHLNRSEESGGTPLAWTNIHETSLAWQRVMLAQHCLMQAVEQSRWGLQRCDALLEAVRNGLHGVRVIGDKTLGWAMEE